MQFRIAPNGRIKMIYSDQFLSLLNEGVASVSRASHVEPCHTGGWTANLAPVCGPILGPFTLRSEALAAEIKWLTENIIEREIIR